MSVCVSACGWVGGCGGGVSCACECVRAFLQVCERASEIEGDDNM